MICCHNLYLYKINGMVKIECMLCMYERYVQLFVQKLKKKRENKTKKKFENKNIQTLFSIFPHLVPESEKKI